MYNSENATIRVPESEEIPCLIQDPVLSLDVLDALKSVGLPPCAAPSEEKVYPGVIVEADTKAALSCPVLARHLQAKVPIICIVTDINDAKALAVEPGTCFEKPVPSDAVVAALLARLGRAAPQDV
jgi:hypothetical protein